MQVDKFIYDRIWGRKERKEQLRENAPKSDPSLTKTVFTTIKDSTVGKVQHVFKKASKSSHYAKVCQTLRRETNNPQDEIMLVEFRKIVIVRHEGEGKSHYEILPQVVGHELRFKRNQ